MRLVLTAVLISAAAVLASCAGGTDTAEQSAPVSGQVAVAPPPTAAAAGPTAALAAAAAASRVTTAPVSEPTASAARPDGCAPGLSLEDQKARLIEIAKGQFLGENQESLPRLQFGPDAKDHRRGGIWLVLEFNGDELDTVALKKAALDWRMRDAYEVFFMAGCDELFWVDLTAIQLGFAKVGMMGESVTKHIPTFKTRLTREDADNIDWANKEALDFDEIWNTFILNIRWRRELAEVEQGG